LEQFRRFANLYFLIVGCIMALGEYTDAFETAISPWTTLGPLAFVISISLLVEGSADYKRHKNDEDTNNAPCTVIRRADELALEEDVERDTNVMKGKDVLVNLNKAFYAEASVPTPRVLDHTESNASSGPGTRTAEVKIAFQKVRRMDIRQGQFVLLKNRNMVPADIVLLASSNDHGGAYIETSSIDGETNLKLRNSPRLPPSVLQHLKEGTTMDKIEESDDEGESKNQVTEEMADVHDFETISEATKRITRFSSLGRPGGRCVLDHPECAVSTETAGNPTAEPEKTMGERFHRFSGKFMRGIRGGIDAVKRGSAFDADSSPPSTGFDDGKYIAALVTEPPNPSVHTFSGKLTLPPFKTGESPIDIPLGADNVLLRGAVLRNTEWAIGVAFFTGTDTKLIQNSFETPSKFSVLDRLMNYTVLAILCIMVGCIAYLATQAVRSSNDQFDNLWYAGFNKDESEPWPYLPNLPPPAWETSSNNWLQFFFLYVTLLNNFIPLSLYVTVEFITFCMLWFIYADREMYDDTTNTRAVARSTIVTDLGRVQYIFSDKTGTLTQNVMRFKRCSVDGMAFGAPIQKAAPGAQNDADDAPFLPLRQLLVGQFKSQRTAGLEGLGGSTSSDAAPVDKKLTFNAEMFLRVLSLCHTVVVEKDLDKKENISSGASAISSASNQKSLQLRASNMAKSLFSRKRSDTNGSGADSPLTLVTDPDGLGPGSVHGLRNRARTVSVNSIPEDRNGRGDEREKGPDGAPYGYAYQAESPDEGALVSAASTTYGFQVIGRDAAGIRLRVSAPSHLEETKVTESLKSGKTSLKRLAAQSASELDYDAVTPAKGLSNSVHEYFEQEEKEETWTILAVNKFDSDRKRMSILLRSPPELGSLPILFCKGADSAMLDPAIVSNVAMITEADNESGLHFPKPLSVQDRQRDVSALSAVDEGEDENKDGVDTEGWEMANMLGLQAHLGDFASEGLRTLVLGMRVLTEAECEEWLIVYKEAAVALKDRSELLTKAALQIEQNIHIVGATAIEDKLQKGVPKTIATLGEAGIKLWVLTGDKRETAVEIGYSTHVLTPRMHLTQVPDNGKYHVRTQMSMEFIRLVKMGKLPDYQHSQLNESGPTTFIHRWESFLFRFRRCWRSVKRFSCRSWGILYGILGLAKAAEKKRDEVKDSEKAEKLVLRTRDRRRRVRRRADENIKWWMQSDEGRAQKKTRENVKDDTDDDLSLASEETPMVFNRASSARGLLNDLRSSGRLSQADIRQLSLAHLTAQQASNEEEPLVDEDTLSLDSFFPGNATDLKGDFDTKKRTFLERMFAIDRQVRKGHLKKHMHWQRLAAIEEDGGSRRAVAVVPPKASDGPRALVIEGAALKHLLGDPEMEEILFSVASSCDAVIACRVSPQQKALLVKLVRYNVKPEPISLAIGDGANDVGMIQEAHVGIGISGKEGQQAVNASDFAIAQFRFLEELVLIHGRWNFFRLSTVVLYSFYKNALMAGILIVFASRTVYSGTPLFDEWLIAMLNFVAAAPIVALGLFDRCLSKEYVRSHPEVYKATRENELITFRTLLRWIALTFVHIFTLFFLTVPQQTLGGGTTPAFEGLMQNEDPDWPGDGEGGDLKSVGTVTFTCMVILLAYKVLYESRSLVHGRWPAFTCRKNVGEGVLSRLAYTWVSITYFSIGFYLFFICIYQLLGRRGPSAFSRFVDTTNHVFGMRSMSWLLVVFVPVTGMIFDVTGKVYSNMFYPTQTQIHLEIESKGKTKARLQRIERTGTRRRQPDSSQSLDV
jgi:magnesium-transporting ATPase (P-type)